eukprot:PhF_6_TR41048/c0_g1_i1/m.62176/K15114/ORT1; mitochondrial ornithine carrier protein
MTSSYHYDDSFKDIAAGTMAGMTSKLIEYPFDTIKVRLQDSRSMYKGVWDCLHTTWGKEGIRGFYRGVAAPLWGAMFETALLFTSYNAILNMFQSDALPVTVIAGAVSGMCMAVVLTPIEVVKCRMQVEYTLPKGERKHYGALHCLWGISYVEGPRGLFRGVGAFVAREGPGNAMWYGAYESSREYFSSTMRMKKHELPLPYIALSGSWAGFWYWTINFPMDTVKTRIQTHPTYHNTGVLRGIKDLYREKGIRGLYPGYSITVARAIPSNAMIFV